MKDSCTSSSPSSKPDWNVWMYLHSNMFAIIVFYICSMSG